MARIDDYRESLRLAAEELKGANHKRLAELAGVEYLLEESGAVVRIFFLGAPYRIHVGDDVRVTREGEDAEVPLPEQILLCHYLLHASGKEPAGELVTFRQIPDGQFYFDAFQRRARDPFLAVFGKQHERFRRCAEILEGRPVAVGDVGMAFQVLPRITVQVILWRGDEEFPPEASILFDTGIRDNLAAEDIAVLSGMLVYRLMGIARRNDL